MFTLLSFVLLTAAAAERMPHWLIFIGGFPIYSLISFAVTTIPVPDGKWGRWLLGVAQKAVFLVERGNNTMNGLDTVSVAVPKDIQGNSMARVAAQVASTAVSDAIEAKTIGQ